MAPPTRPDPPREEHAILKDMEYFDTDDEDDADDKTSSGNPTPRPTHTPATDTLPAAPPSTAPSVPIVNVHLVPSSLREPDSPSRAPAAFSLVRDTESAILEAVAGKMWDVDDGDGLGTGARERHSGLSIDEDGDDAGGDENGSENIIVLDRRSSTGGVKNAKEDAGKSSVLNLFTGRRGACSWGVCEGTILNTFSRPSSLDNVAVRHLDSLSLAALSARYESAIIPDESVVDASQSLLRSRIKTLNLILEDIDKALQLYSEPHAHPGFRGTEIADLRESVVGEAELYAQFLDENGRYLRRYGQGDHGLQRMESHITGLLRKLESGEKHSL
ncbi:hypothetical protein BDK51DRAFT_37339 [Blyttiomyces helicus]|uniref:Uncharacterized protein n=1 Tax=Blyttiomyces helicus TaxID=388810 RepID=A0A4V1IPK2_9FUNG|nr:hypothetical protein BDK51DRAFT_37339 [Blyttiomyces helicus]|eukprot:RKO83347.1 hypothetical protein BDK51DRAFT_37339 [Blyttiomyces helicus]